MAKKKVQIHTNKNIGNTTGTTGKFLPNDTPSLQQGETTRDLLQSANAIGSNMYGRNYSSEDMASFFEKQPWVQNEIPGFNPEDPAHVGKFQQLYDQKAKDFAKANGIDPYTPYFQNDRRQGEGFDSKFGLHTFNAPPMQQWNIPDIPALQFDPQLITADMPIDKVEPKVTDGNFKQIPVEPPGQIPPVLDARPALPANPPSPELPPPTVPEVSVTPGNDSSVTGKEIGMSSLEKGMGGLMGSFTDQGDKWKEFRNDYAEEALKKATGYRNDAELKRSQDNYALDKQLGDLDVARQGALLSAQRANAGRNQMHGGDIGGNIGAASSLAAAYGAGAQYDNMAQNMREQSLSRDGQNLDRINQYNTNIGNSEYGWTDFRDTSKNYMTMMQNGLDSMMKQKRLAADKAATIYEDQQKRVMA